MTDLDERLATDPLDLAAPLAQRFVEGVTGEAEGFDDCYGSRCDEVESESRDGFIAYTDGGYEGCAYGLLSYAHGSGCAPAAIQSIIDSSLKDAEEEFQREHGISVDELYKQRSDMQDLWNQPAIPGIGKADYPPEPELLETWHELQDSWLSEGGTYFYKVSVLFYRPENYRNDSGDYEVRMFAYLNTDLEYGRDHISWLPAMGGKADQTTGDWERTMTAAEFIALGESGIDDLITEAVKHLANL